MVIITKTKREDVIKGVQPSIGLIEFGSPIRDKILKAIKRKAEPRKSPEDVRRGIA